MSKSFFKFNNPIRKEDDNKKVLDCGCVYETEINSKTGESEEKIKLCPKHAEEQKEKIKNQNISSSQNIIKHYRPQKINE